MQGLGHLVKTEKEQGSSLIRDTAIEAHASWTRLNEKLNSLEDNISKFNYLVILLCKSVEEESATEIKINESIVQLEGYATRVAEVRSTDIVAFREIEAIDNPPPTVTPDNQRQGQSIQQGAVIFKP